jgi:hypothetical protein
LTGITPPAQNAFAYCPLSEITVDSSNTKYDSRDNCNAIIETATNTLIVGCASTTIPSSVTGITENAFIFCEHLTSITIPSNVTNIAGTTFPNCPNLTSIIVDENNPVYDSRDNCNAIIETATNTFISGCKNSIIPNSVTSIAKYAFCCNGLTSITIPKGVTSIGERAFKEKWNEIHAQMTTPSTIDGTAFEGVDKSTCILYVPEGSVDAYKAADVWKDFENIVAVPNPNKYIYYTSSDGNIVTPNSTDEFGANIVSNTYTDGQGCIEFDGEVTRIGHNAFLDYTRLTSIQIPNSVTSIGYRAFIGCKNLASFSLPDSLVSIETDAFAGCERFTYVTIPKKVTNIGWYVYNRCKNLTTISVEDGNTIYDSRNNCNAIIETATNTLIQSCDNTTIPESVTSIGFRAFFGSHITTITIPNGVTSIDDYAFWECYDLITVIIPKSVNRISSAAFGRCGSIAEIHAGMLTPPAIDSSVFDGVNKTTCTLYVPAESVDAYKAADNWKDFENIVAEQYPDTDISGFDNILYAPTLEVRPGQQAMLSICLKNAVELSSFGFRLFLPEGVSIAWSEEDNDYAINLNPSRASLKRFTTSFAEQTDGSMLIICYSTQNHSFTGNDGEVINILLDIADEMADGDYAICINHQEMATASMTTFNVAQCKSTLTVLSYLLGDVNGDQQVSVVDINGVVNLILGTNTNGLLLKAADTNCDGSISVVDINGVVNIILYGNPMGPSPAPALRGKWATEPAAIRMDDVSLCNGRTTLVGLTVEGVAGTYSSMQFDVLLPEGITMDVKSDNHHLVCTALQDDGTTRVVCTSLSNHPFTGNTPLTISLTADEAAEGDYALTLTHIELASPHLTTTHPADYTAALRVHGTTGINMLNASDGQPLYNLQGIRMEGGSNMEKGVFIQNNKKIFKK